MEKTFVMIKPDGVQRSLIGECIRRFEKAGLKIVALKMLKPTKELVEKHYPSDEGWLKTVGERSIKTFTEQNIDIKKKFGTTNSLAIGKVIKSWLVNFISSGPVVVMIIEGNKAIDNVRRICGETDPMKALPGSIRGDFSIDNVILGNSLERPIVNVIHASGNTKEAENEISLWFKTQEICEYKRIDEEIFYKKW